MPLSDYQAMLERALEGKYVDRVTHEPRQSKSDFLDYFRTEYGKQGTRKAAEYLHSLGIVKNRQGEPVKVESLMRRFQSRGGKSQGEMSTTYAAASANLPAKEIHHKELPKQLTLTIHGRQGTGEKGVTRERDIPVSLKGEDVRAFMENPSYQLLLYRKGYQPDLIEKFNDGTYKLTITSVS